MGISQQIGASSLIKPGVIDSAATRPASPYEGQVIFQKDTDQMLVWNGTAWVIPNSPAQNPMGLGFVASGTLSAAGTISVNNCFSSTYDNYKIVLTDISPSATVDVRFNFSTGGTINTTGNYWMQNTFKSGTSISSNEESTQTSFRCIYAQGGSNGYAWFEVITPFATANTNVWQQGVSYASAIIDRSFVGFFNTTTSFDGFKLVVASGTVSAKYTVYGYRK